MAAAVPAPPVGPGPLAPAAGAGGAATASAGASPAPVALPAPHPHEQEISDIRRHHLQRLHDKLATDPQVLRDNCRYESDIATAPPPRRVVLSFDDGPEPGQTDHILAVLAKYDVPAVFFMIGEKMQRHPELVERVRAGRGHVIGNHSWDHPNFHDIEPARQAEEVLRGEALLAPAGDAAPRLFRYPFGNASCATNALVRARGYRIVGWHIDSCDWAFERTGSVDLKEATSCGVLPQLRSDYVGHVLASVRARNGGIVLMHEIHPNTIRRLEDIIVQIRADGYTFDTLQDAAFEASLR